jgi:hypothetical protein
MATAPVDNNPAGQPPVEPTSEGFNPAEDAVDLAEVFGLGGSSTSEADRIAAGLGAQPPAPVPAAGEQPAQAGEVGSAPASPDTSPAAAQPATGTPPAPAAPAPSAPAPAAPPAVDEAALKTASLEAQVAALTATIDQLRANPQPGQQPPAAPESGQAPEGQIQPEVYNLTLPPQVLEAIQSEDAAVSAQGLNRLINDVATIIHNNVLTKATAHTNTAIQNLISQASQGQQAEQRTQAREEAQQAYYTAFPQHNNPVVLPIIQHQAQLMAAEFPNLAWGPDYVNALGARVNNAIAALSGGQPQAQPAPTPPMPNVPPAKPAAMMPVGGQRPAGAPSSEVEGSDLIMDTLSVFSG